jgi:hypothetical protein
LKEAFSKSWSKATTYPETKNNWSPKNPASGQCAVTSLVINDLYGGKIAYNKAHRHYWNILADGSEVDLTREQFGDNVVINEYTIATRHYILESDAANYAKTSTRYRLLKKKIEKLLLVESIK